MEYYELLRDFTRHQTLVFRDFVNKKCVGKEPIQIILITVFVTLILTWLYHFLFDENVDTHWVRFKRQIFKIVRALPPVKRKIKAEMNKLAAEIETSFNRDISEPMVYKTRLPAKGFSSKEVLAEARKYKRMNKVDWKSGMVSGAIYNGNDDLTKLMSDIFSEFAWTNPLHPDIFLDIRRMEAEVVRMCCTAFNGDSKTCGTMTSGGTESIMLACRTYRDIALDRGIEYPEIIAPITVHAAFEKSAQYLRMKITHIPTDEKTGKVVISAMKKAINRRTCMLVGSAPGFPHGIIDDIAEISNLGLKYDVPVHVDCCLGGYLYPFMEKAGFPVPISDFRIPGVTSISCDTHKYGFAPKGSSVILYRDESYRLRQIFVASDWPGGIYASPTIPGSRPGVVIAQTWAALVHFGEDGYVKATKQIIRATRKLSEGLKKQPHIKVFGDPLMMVVSVGSDKFNIFRLFDALTSRGWSLNALQFPSSFHVCCTMLHTKPGVIEKFLEDVARCVEEIMKDPDADIGGMAMTVYGSSQKITDRSLIHLLASSFMNSLFQTNNPQTNGTTA